MSKENTMTAEEKQAIQSLYETVQEQLTYDTAVELVDDILNSITEDISDISVIDRTLWIVKEAYARGFVAASMMANEAVKMGMEN